MVIHKIDLAGKLIEPIEADNTLTFKLLNGTKVLNLTGAVVEMYVKTGDNVSVVEGTITNSDKGYVEFALDLPIGAIAIAEIVVTSEEQIVSSYVFQIYFLKNF